MTDSGDELTHVGPGGKARMVDVSDKPETERWARASGVIRMLPATLQAIRANALEKGDVIAVARVAGVLAAKRTSELIPLCHPVPLTDLQVDMLLEDALPGVRVVATARCRGRTGVEMEAIVAVSVTLITLYDMAKSADKSMQINDIRLLEKHGGRSGSWRADGGMSVAL